MAVVFVVLLFAVFMGIREIFSPFSSGKRRLVPTAENTIGLITVEGTIAAGGGGLFSGEGGGDQLLENIRRAGDDPIKALVVRINSPGGSAAASQEIYAELKKIREKGKIVVVSMADMAASGGYLIACAADYIVANPATVTGSIGVIIDATNTQGLYDLLGIEYEVIKSGEFKDTLHPARPLTDAEKELLAVIVGDIYDQFVDTVVEGRGLGRAKVLTYADGRVLTGRQALEIGLVDELGNLYDALDIAAEKADIKGKPQVHRYGSQNLWNMLFSGSQLNFEPFSFILGERNLLLQ
ncbi:MAG: signal peptide peptidase SppA [Firmicutes bacterium]|nr:signal peptide peptidase SppA [Bacillota bacterium]